MKEYYDYAKQIIITEEDLRAEWESFKEEFDVPDLPYEEYLEELVLHNNETLEEIK